MNKILEEQWEVIKKTSEVQKRTEWLKFCQLVISLVESGKITIQDASYNICGISAHVIKNMKLEDKEIMNIACNLELPIEHQSKNTGDWETLIKKVKTLNRN